MILYVQVEVLSAVVDSIANNVGANAIIDVGSGQVVLLSFKWWSIFPQYLLCFHFFCLVLHSFSFAYTQIAKLEPKISSLSTSFDRNK